MSKVLCCWEYKKPLNQLLLFQGLFRLMTFGSLVIQYRFNELPFILFGLLQGLFFKLRGIFVAYNSGLPLVLGFHDFPRRVRLLC